MFDSRLTAGSHRSRRRFGSGIAAVLGALTFVLPSPVWAAVTILPQCARTSGTFGAAPDVPQISCFMETMGNIALLILGVTGSFALLMFVYGGFMIVISGGDSGRVTKGKTIVKNAVIGIVIIMTSGLILNYALAQLLGTKSKTQIIGQYCSGTGDKATLSTKPTKSMFVQKPDGSISCEPIGTPGAKTK